MRRAADRLLWLITGGAALAALLALAGIAGILLWRGLPALEPGFVLRAAGDRLDDGGILYQLAGTLLLVATALAVCLPLATGVALAQTVYLRPRAAERLRLTLYTLNGVPSILFGLFGLAVFVKAFGWGKSWLAGGILLGLMILPTVAVSLAVRIAALPRRYLAAAAGLGLGRTRTVWSVILPQSVGGLVSGALLGLARAAGETAPILFTAAVFSGATLPSGVRESPVLALPYHVFVLAQDSLDPAAESHLWASAFVLLGLVLAASLAALPARLAASEEARHG